MGVKHHTSTKYLPPNNQNFNLLPNFFAHFNFGGIFYKDIYWVHILHINIIDIEGNLSTFLIQSYHPSINTMKDKTHQKRLRIWTSKLKHPFSFTYDNNWKDNSLGHHTRRLSQFSMGHKSFSGFKKKRILT